VEQAPKKPFQWLWWSLILTLTLVIAAIALPATRSGGRCKDVKYSCINNLRQIDGAKEQWALENKKSAGAPTVPEEILQYIKGGKVVCPKGGIYTFGPVDSAPRCSIAGHTLK
jgi:hypothetical protein